MSIGQMTVAEASMRVAKTLVRGCCWVGTMMLTCWLLSLEYNWRIFVLCVVSGLADAVIYGPARAELVFQRKLRSAQ